MQNRGMFPYRRQGPKKRKNGPPRNKMRGPQKGLPNSARDLLPILQSATKALAQMLAGRTRASGQLGHAESALAQAERLIGERAHNRLNPVEREEFFEQLARLKLTLADAEDEAGVQAEQEEAKPVPRAPVAQERLKEMALALTTPDRSRAAPADANGEEEAGTAAAEPEGAAQPADESAARTPERPEQGDRPAEQGEAEPRPEGRSLGNAQSGRLQLSRSAAERAASAVSITPRTRATAARSTRARPAEAGDSPAEPADEKGEPAGAPAPSTRPRTAVAAAPTHADEQPGRGNGQDAPRRPRRPKQQGLPEGWVIDEEGFVVPGP